MLLKSTFELDLSSWSQEGKEAENSVPNILQSFRLIWMECGKLLRLVGVMNLISFYLFNSRERT